jgi:hypothetical protein
MKKQSTEQFIIEAKEKHGDKYDYSKVEYENNLKEVIIICKEHGEFLQLPKTHKRGNGCKDCGFIIMKNKQKSNTYDFINKSIIKHGDKYDYSKVVYINAFTKVIIICKEHDEFLQTPNGHLSNNGCKKCGTIIITNKSRKNINEFIEEAKIIHGDKYDYSKVIYISNNTNVIIICKEHGEFLQTPSTHLKSKIGCQACSFISTSNKNRKNIDEFIEEAKEKHGDKYDYSKVDYVSCHSKVIIICKEHGDFLQDPISHINGFGCSKCAGCCKLTTCEFIEEAKEKHGYKYDYSKVEYINSKANIVIICKKHGEFLQQPNNHLSGQNCPNCRIPNHSKMQIDWLKFISILHKISIQYAVNGIEFTIPSTKYKADGYCKENNTIYEFHGDFWHGNPKIYNNQCINKVKNMSFGEIYQKTLEREQLIRDLGYNLVVMWENDWKTINKSIKILQKKIRSNR